MKKKRRVLAIGKQVRIINGPPAIKGKIGTITGFADTLEVFVEVPGIRNSTYGEWPLWPSKLELVEYPKHWQKVPALSSAELKAAW